MLVIAVIFIYVVANLGVVRYYWREERAKFNWILHGVFPVGTSAILIYSLYKSFSPCPARPYNWSPVIVGVLAADRHRDPVYLRLEGRGLAGHGQRGRGRTTPRPPTELQHRARTL